MKRALFLLAACAALHGQTIRDVAVQRGVLFGAAVDPSRFGEAAYSATLANEFNQAEPENAMKFGPIHPGPTTYNWSQADAIVSFAQTHGMAVRGHTLVWHSQNPSWINGLSSADLAAALHNHISTVVGRYAGKVYAWDVVNEAFSDSGGALRSTVWSDSPGIGLPGTGYIEQAFRWAREADPNALLFYNDYSAEGVNTKSDAIYRMLQDFKARGVPVDGVGMQMHFTTSTPSMASIEANMKRIADLGLRIHITELDVRLPVDASGAATSAALATQAKIYGDVVTVCLKFPACTAIQTWGVTDKYSWVPSTFHGSGAALPFDTAYAPKPAHDAIVAAMQTAPPVISAAGLVNAASYAGAAVAPGEIVVLFGPTFGPADLSTSGVRLLFDGVPAPLLYARVGQASAVVPFGVAGKTSVSVQYEFQGIASNAVTVPVSATLPGLFSLDSSGAGGGAILNALTGAVISSSNPAHAGDYLSVFATGLGVTTPAVDGQPVSGVAPAAAKVAVSIGGVDCPVLYAGGAPGLIAGAAQINVQIPAAVPAGEQPVLIIAGGVSSQSGLTVSIR